MKDSVDPTRRLERACHSKAECNKAARAVEPRHDRFRSLVRNVLGEPKSDSSLELNTPCLSAVFVAGGGGLGASPKSVQVHACRQFGPCLILPISSNPSAPGPGQAAARVPARIGSGPGAAWSRGGRPVCCFESESVRVCPRRAVPAGRPKPLLHERREPEPCELVL